MPPVRDFPDRPLPPLKIAISECLLGREVRYDGSDAATSFPQRALEDVFTYVPICPEVGIGLGVPRDPIRLIGDPNRPNVVFRDADVPAEAASDPGCGSGIDLTGELRRFAEARLAEMDDVAGYVFMQDSPSCGLFQVHVYPQRGNDPPSPTGRGVYARTITDALPGLPVEEGARLFDARLRELFVERVFRYAHWQRIVAYGSRASHVSEFNRRYGADGLKPVSVRDLPSPC